MQELDGTRSCQGSADVSSPEIAAAAAAALPAVQSIQQDDEAPDFEAGKLPTGSNERLSSRHVAEPAFPSLRMDGPYGAPAQEYRRYKTVLLVGAGIGITPFVSILRDLLHRCQPGRDQVGGAWGRRPNSHLVR